MKLTILFVIAFVATLTSPTVISQVPVEETLPLGSPVLVRGATLTPLTTSANMDQTSQKVIVGEAISVPREYKNPGDFSTKETPPRPGPSGRQYH